MPLAYVYPVLAYKRPSLSDVHPPLADRTFSPAKIQNQGAKCKNCSGVGVSEVGTGEDDYSG